MPRLLSTRMTESTHSTRDSSRSLRSQRTLLICTQNCQFAAFCLVSAFLITSSRMSISFCKQRYMSWHQDFATSSTVSCSPFNCLTSLRQKATSYFNYIISSSSWSMAALKLKGCWERMVQFDWPAMVAPTVARPPAGPSLLAVNPPALLLPAYINKMKRQMIPLIKIFVRELR